MILNQATGSGVSIQLRDSFLEPLGLTQTYLVPEETLPSTIAHGWFNLSGDSNDEDISLLSLNGIYSVFRTSAGIFTTAEERAEWCADLFKGDVLDPSSLDQMMSPCCSMPGTKGVGCGISVAVIINEDNATLLDIVTTDLILEAPDIVGMYHEGSVKKSTPHRFGQCIFLPLLHQQS